jgi:hypothetical protein
MSTEQGTPSIPPPPGSRHPEKNRTVVFIVVAAGAILALVFVTAILVLVLWKAGFFTTKSAPVLRVENKELKVPASEGAPVLHIRSKSLNVLDGKSLIMESAGEVRRADGYLVVSDSESLRLQGPITVSAWFKARSFDKAMTVAGRAQNGPPWQYPFLSWLIRINTDSVVEGDVGHGRSYSPAGWAVSTLLPEQWYFVCMTYDGNKKALFLNGLLQNQLASGSMAASGMIGNTPGKPILIGADESESPVGDVFDGAIDDVRVFDRALPEEEIQALFTKGTKTYGVR